MIEDRLREIFEEERTRLSLQDIDVTLNIVEMAPSSQGKPIPLIPFEWRNLYLLFSAMFGVARELTPQVVKTKEGRYPVSFSSSVEDLDRFRESCRHELYHVAAGHCEVPYNFLRYLILQEPMAIVYQKKLIKAPKTPKINLT